MRILIIDDSNFIRSKLRDLLEGNGFEVIGEAANGESGIDLALSLHPDVITLDNILPDMTGLDVLKELEGKSHARVIMISAVGQQSAINEGVELGATAYLVKPFDDSELIQIIKGLEV